MESRMKRFLPAFVLLVMLIASVLPARAETRRLENFEALMAALKQGESVRVVIDYGRCRLMMDGKPADAPKAIGGMAIEVFEYFAPKAVGNPKAFVVFSETSLINHPKRGFVQNYVKFKVREDDSVEVTAQYIKPVTMRIVMDETFTSVIDDAKNQGAVSFFAQK